MTATAFFSKSVFAHSGKGMYATALLLAVVHFSRLSVDPQGTENIMGIEVHRIICNPSARPHKRKEAPSSRRSRRATAKVVFARSGKKTTVSLAAMHFSWCTIGNIREVEEGGIFSAGKCAAHPSRPPLRKISAEATAVIHTAIKEPSVSLSPPPTPKTSLHVYISF